MTTRFTPEQRAAYERDGYVLVRGLFDTEEITLLRRAIEEDPQLRTSLYDRKDADGKPTRMATWNHPGDSVYGLAARSHRVVDTLEDMLGGEVYHYHSKLTAKEPYEGGAWEWHQDYGYWYHNGCVCPTWPVSWWRSTAPRARTAACRFCGARTAPVASITVCCPATRSAPIRGASRR